MDKCRWIPEIERWFDGQAANEVTVHDHLKTCLACAGHLAMLRSLRKGAQAAVACQPVSEPAFDPFMAGVWERTERAAPRRRAFWAIASLSAAALLVAVSVFLIFSNKMPSADATVVESCSSDLADATITTYATDNGVTTVCITVSRDDVW